MRPSRGYTFLASWGSIEYPVPRAAGCPQRHATGTHLGLPGLHQYDLHPHSHTPCRGKPVRHATDDRSPPLVHGCRAAARQPVGSSVHRTCLRDVEPSRVALPHGPTRQMADRLATRTSTSKCSSELVTLKLPHLDDARAELGHNAVNDAKMTISIRFGIIGDETQLPSRAPASFSNCCTCSICCRW